MRFNKDTDSTEDETPKPPPPKKSHYFTIPLTIGYYTLVFPFKPVHDPNTDTIVLQANRFQKSLCYTSWTLTLLNRLTTLRLTIQSTASTHTPTSYFQLTHSVLHVIPYLIYFYIAFSHSTSITKILNSIHKSTCLVQNSTRNSALRLFVLLTQSLWLLLTITSPIVGYETINSYCWTPTTLISSYTTHGKYTTFSINSPLPPSPPSTLLDHLTCILQILTLTSHVALLFFIVCLFGNTCITLYSAASGFYETVMKTYDRDVEANCEVTSLKSSYGDLKCITSSVNGTFYMLCFWYMIDLMSWLSTELDSGLRTNDYFVRVHIFYYLVYLCVCVCFSAEAFRKTEKLHKFIKTDKNAATLVNEQSTTQDIDQITRSLKHDVVGIGEVGFFRINYSFIGQMTGLIITFYIISVEEHTKDEGFGVMGC